MTKKDYLDLITSEHKDAANFISVVTANISIPIRIQDLLNSLLDLFDVDTAVGSQLDTIGKWVGITRNVSIPIDGIYFSWDSDAFVGWEFGSWRPSTAPATITELPDDAYRNLIRTKIAANSWDGTTEGAYKIWDEIFPTLKIFIQDHQNMSYDLGIAGGIVDSLTLALLSGGYIPLRPEGVKVSVYFVSIDSSPLFGWDVDSSLLGGWGTGSWAREISST